MKIEGFTIHNPKHHTNIFGWPEEDSFSFSQTKNQVALVVADGITRDPLNLPTLPDYKSLIGEAEFALEYPLPSPARKAANLFCQSFIKLSKLKKPSLKNLKEVMKKSNEQIKNLNKKNNPSPDYLQNDFWACVASAAIIKNQKLYWTYITDCGLAVFSPKGKLKFQTRNEQPNPKISKQILREKIYGKSWRDPGVRKRTRSKYRNNPNEPLSYGALTGENNALKYIRYGKLNIQEDDFIFLYSDGFFPIISRKSFKPNKIKNLKQYFQDNSKKIDGSEGTILAIIR
jgi:serine/threonine protein phosphatase PrpC